MTRMNQPILYQRIAVLLVTLVFGLSLSLQTHASTISGGSYTLNGGPTAISSAESSGGMYAEQSTADPASGNSSGAAYGTTPAPAAPVAQNQNGNTGSQNNNITPSVPMATGGNSGISGQIVMQEMPVAASAGTGVTSGSGNARGPSSISLFDVRLVRGTPTSITVYFTTSDAAIGSVRYSPSVGEVTTLTDSVPSSNHSFTITSLTSSLVYQFQLAAISESGASSQVYQVSVSPDQLGEEGGSVRPTLVPYSPGAKKTPLAKSSSPESSSVLHELPPYIYGLFALIVAIIIGIVWARRRRSL